MMEELKCKICDEDLGRWRSHSTAQTKLLDHIRIKHPNWLAWIYAQQDVVGELRRKVAKKTGYDILR